MKRFNFPLIALMLMVPLAGTLFVQSAEAIFPGNFWRIVDEESKFLFRIGSQSDAEVKIHMLNNGAVGIGSMPSNDSVILELNHAQKGFLVPRVSNVESIQSPRNGMMVFHDSANCFKVFQRGRLGEANGWADCIGIADRITVRDEEPSSGTPGELYYNSVSRSLYIRGQENWMILSADRVIIDEVVPSAPVSRPGDLYFDPLTNRLLIFDGSLWQNVSVDFSRMTSLHANCVNRTLPNGSKNFSCGDNRFLSGLRLENGAWSGRTDYHTPPEVNGFECCGISFVPDDGTHTFECDNLIINGGFESGNTGFTTDYTLFTP